MKIAVIADIHSNLEALTAVLKAIESQQVDAIYCLGDVVGYGPDPGPCVDLVQHYCTGCVRGNHDEAVALEVGIEYLPHAGQRAAQHNRQLLTETQLEFLAQLPLTLEAHDCTFVHASPAEPRKWSRLDTFQEVRRQFEHFHTTYCFVGHTHIPALMADKIGVFKIKPGHRYIINPGSVGQPRDLNPRASFAIFEPETHHLEIIRIPYNTSKTAAKIKEAGLPKALGIRLSQGR